VEVITELESSLIWNTIIDLLPGDPIQNKKLSYESTDFGILSQKGIVEIMVQIFGAKHSKDRKEKRKLIFDLAKLDRMERIYELSTDIKVSTTSSGVTDMTDVTHIGLDKHLIEQSSDDQLANSNTLNDNNCKEIEKINNNNKEIRSKKEEEGRCISIHPSPVEESLSSSSLPSDKDKQPSPSSAMTSAIGEKSSIPILPSQVQEQEQQHKRFNFIFTFRIL
jgi:hypothetical protein